MGNGYKQKKRGFCDGQGPRLGFRLLWMTLVADSSLPSKAALSEPPIPAVYIGGLQYSACGVHHFPPPGLFSMFISNDQFAIMTISPGTSIGAFASISRMAIPDVFIQANGTFSAANPTFDTVHVGQLSTDVISRDDYTSADQVPHQTSAGPRGLGRLCWGLHI